MHSTADETPQEAPVSLPANAGLQIYISVGPGGGFVGSEDGDDLTRFSLVEDGFTDERREHVFHRLWDATLGGPLAMAPLEKYPARMTELGFGGTTFVSEIVYQNPNARVHSIDCMGSRSEDSALRFLAHAPAIVCRNVETDDWGLEPRLSGKQALVATRFEPDGLEWNWAHVMRQSLAALEPGGWFEMQVVGPISSDDGSTVGTALRAIPRLISCSSAAREESDGAFARAEAMTAAGFVDVAVMQRRWWATPVAHRTDIEHADRDLARLYAREVASTKLLETACEEVGVYSKWTNRETRRLLHAARAESCNPRIQAYYPVYIINGRKPAAVECDESG